MSGHGLTVAKRIPVKRYCLQLIIFTLHEYSSF